MDHGDENQILVDNVDGNSFATKNDMNKSGNSSINAQGDVAIDHFLSKASTANQGDSQIQKDMMKSSRYSYMNAGGHGLTVTQGALAILSTCVGGGIVSLPLAMYNLGAPLSIFLQCLVMVATHSSSNLYLYIRDIVPDKPDSLYEIGYMIVGRGSIFVLGSIFWINSFGLCLIYFMVFGDTLG